MTDPASKPSVTADALVIGAGVVGCSIALQLARAGLAVTVLDRNRSVAAGSTSASSAVVRFHYSTRAGVIASAKSRITSVAGVGPSGSEPRAVRTASKSTSRGNTGPSAPLWR